MNSYNLNEEKRLYAEARSLKFKAREMRKKRIAEEEARREAERLNKIAEDKLKEDALKLELRARKIDQDNRIRRALLSTAEAFKREQIAFDCPFSLGDKAHSFYVIDKKNSVGKISIRIVAGKGFEWD